MDTYGPGVTVPGMPRQGPYPGANGEQKPGMDEHADKMVYVGNLAYAVKWQDLKDHMAQAGTVEFARILTEDGTEYGPSRGTGYVRYATEAEAQSAMLMLKETDLKGRKILVDSWNGSNGKGAANRPKGAGKGGYAPMMKGKGCWGGKGSWGGGKSTLQVAGDPRQLVYVGNLAYSVNWQDLKTHMSQAGTVEFAKVLTEDGTDFGRSRGTGCVRFASEAEANSAIQFLAETELKGRKILVDHWEKKGPANGASPA